MGLWNRVIGFKKVVNKYYILLSLNISCLLPKSYFFIFLKKKLNKQYQFLFIKKKIMLLCGTPRYTAKNKGTEGHDPFD
jgi:hypothetical protein